MGDKKLCGKCKTKESMENRSWCEICYKQYQKEYYIRTKHKKYEKIKCDKCGKQFVKPYLSSHKCSIIHNNEKIGV